MLTSASSASSQSTTIELKASPATNEEKDGFAALPATSNAPGQLLTLTTNGQSHLASVSTPNGLTTIPATSNGYHHVYTIPATTTGHHQSAIPGSSNGYHQQIPMPETSNGMNYGHYNNGVHYTSSNGNMGYAPNMSNGVQMMNGRPPTQIVYPMRPNGGYSVNTMNGSNGYVNGIVNGRYVRPGWVSTSKVVNGVKKQKRNRTAFTSHQMMELEQEYARARYLDRTRRIELSESLNLNQRTIKIWFQNRRMKEKKDRLEEVTTSDSPPANINDLPIYIQDDSYVPVGVENGHYNQALYADSSPMLAMSPMLPPAMPQVHQVPELPYLVENAIPAYNPVHGNGIQAPQPPMVPLNGTLAENVPKANAEENWDLSWIRSINISDDIELA